ncbi:hydroxymethylglutaryl-CoA lyase [Ectobacillus sp. JY-23]|uniref:hydroxymethylglutaryl-CoA lyase n=1 Tax=Ectobacillus sp. JY-23 TaxID=2933872 RepID=UPI001FF6D12D|nr:hydroxymethylglutaryl-CoA lyase [Ectobacillus sp. JY-23]UOY92959.1 hydroxymethylglutaryl-CoA lyase [Ectobacillus sp. JY-23]
MKLPASVQIKEVGPRDGLQNEKQIVATADKVQWINMLSETGLTYIEVSSFVHPKWIPALSDATDVFHRIQRQSDVIYTALVPNQRGLERALAAEADEVNVFLSASETHSQKNINKSISEAFQTIKEVTTQSLLAGKKVRGYVSTVFGCPYEGRVEFSAVERLCEDLLASGVYEISLGDTIGVANPMQVESVLTHLLKHFPASVFAMHFHNTYGMALPNILTSLQAGITVFDSSCGGLGGCPYAPGASGNVATNDVVHMLHQMGIRTNINENKLFEASRFIADTLQTSLPSQVYQAGKPKTISR